MEPNPYDPPKSEVEDVSLSAAALGEFRDPTKLTSWAKRLLYALVVISLIAIVSGVLEHQVLRDLQNGSFGSEADATAAANSSDARQVFVGVLQFGAFVASGIVLLMWIYRASFNARQLGAEDMQFSPGWAVGWYFIPFLNLWKPYQAMKEIWQASANPANWRAESIPSLLGWWWLFWVASNLVANASFRMSLRAKEMDALLAANVVTLVSDVLEIPLCLIVLALVGRIHRMQMSEAARRS